MSASLFVFILGLCYCCGESSEVLGVPRLFGPSEALVNSVVDFKCELQSFPQNESILLQLFKEGNRDELLGEYTSLTGEVASFPKVIKPYHEGNLECEAKAQNNTNIEPTLSNVHYLRVVVPVKGAEIETLSGPPEFFEGSTLELRCKLTAGSHVSYDWLLDGRLVSRSLHHNHLLISRASSNDSGFYMCVATNHFNKTQVFSSNSSEVIITVKEFVSNPEISFTVSKEDSHNYSAMVTCQSTKGTVPIVFSLYSRTALVTNATVEDRYATFKVPLVLEQHLGWLQCQANNGNHTAYSTWIPLEVVPVGGPVLIHYDYDVGENFAVIGVRFYCKAAKGSLPRYQWFLNQTLLHERGSFYYVVNQPPAQSILLLSVRWSGAGTYHCQVSDSFDSTNAISSNRLYLSKDELNRLPVVVVAVVFGCFTVIVLLVCFCSWRGVLFRRRQYGLKSRPGREMDRMVSAYERELELSEFSEDADIIKTARGDEFDQESVTSVDEWPQIEREKKTLEDEAAEEP